MDYNDPSTWLAFFGPYSKLGIPNNTSPRDVRNTATERSTRIHELYHALHDILIRHEKTIQKRWTKKTMTQRQRILLACWPSMAASHGPDFAALRRQRNTTRETFLCPYINQEDLSKPRNLLLLLNTRGHNHPSTFASSDLEAMNLGIVTSALEPLFLSEYTMVLNGTLFPNGAADVKTYGSLISWVDNSDAIDVNIEGWEFDPGEGLLVLEAQERVLKFLVLICKTMLQDVPGPLISDMHPPYPCPVPVPAPKVANELDEFESLAIMAQEAPYRLPAKLDLARIESLMEARLGAAIDHFWALREDPSYFSETLQDLKEHRQEMAKQVRALHTKYAASSSPSKNLRYEYLDAILKFRFQLLQTVKGHGSKLQKLAIGSPPFRKFYIRQPPESPTSSNMLISSSPAAYQNETVSYVQWILSTIWDDGPTLQLFGRIALVDQFAYLLQSDSQANNLMSARVADIIGSLSITTQCLGQLERYPWARSYAKHVEARKETIRPEFAEWSRLLATLLSAVRDTNLLGVVNEGLADVSPTKKRFHYPVDKRRTKETVDALRSAERNLDKFWSAIDRILLPYRDRLEGSTVGSLLFQPRSLQRTESWEDVPKKKRTEIAVQDIGDIAQPFSELSIEERMSATPTTPKRMKIKTRGVPGSSTDSPTPQQPVDDSATSSPLQITVDARAHKTLRAIFFVPGASSQPGEVPWRDFIHAMVAAGLTPQKQYGSSWMFTAADGRAIHIHEPHPHNRMPFWTARQYGRRLHRKYGWTAATFVLAVKVTNSVSSRQ